MRAPASTTDRARGGVERHCRWARHSCGGEAGWVSCGATRGHEHGDGRLSRVRGRERGALVSMSLPVRLCLAVLHRHSWQHEERMERARLASGARDADARARKRDAPDALLSRRAGRRRGVGTDAARFRGGLDSVRVRRRSILCVWSFSVGPAAAPRSCSCGTMDGCAGFGQRRKSFALRMLRTRYSCVCLGGHSTSLCG